MRLAFGSLLFLLACRPPSVDDIVFPAVAIETDGWTEGYLSSKALTTTSRQRIERYTGLEIIDANGRSFVVREVREIDPPGILSDWAGNKSFQVEMTLERGPKRSPKEAADRVIAAIRDPRGYLDLTEEGREAVAAKLQGRSVSEIATALATTYEPRRVQADAIRRNNARVEALAREGR